MLHQLWFHPLHRDWEEGAVDAGRPEVGEGAMVLRLAGLKSQLCPLPAA